ncbi:MAG: preprotein translocase subunit SecY [Candidatus Saccharibacteria bacterium]|nr:preprotein translocase subunit SecY [Candidatus Saccharibacteria bacterium]MCY4010966.1 preprotein translocase subunit SecY [Candidatus Saccharibacteria bacterium]
MNWKLIWRGIKTPAMRNKLLAILGILLVYRMLSHIPIPLAEPTVLKQLIDNLFTNEGIPELLSIYNLLSGGALTGLSIMLVGVAPYITASIIMQVLTRAIPKLEKMQKEGEYGRKKINQYTRLLTLPLAISQSILMLFFVRQATSQISGLGDIFGEASLGTWLLMIASLTTGAMILMWLGELITEKNIGNGISLLITVAIISQLPLLISSLYRSVTTDDSTAISIFNWFDVSPTLIYVLVLLLITFLLTVFIVYVNEAYRKIKLSYAKRIQGNRVYGGVNTFLPIKLILAGVIPIIFATSFLSIPQLMSSWLSNVDSLFWADLGTNLGTWFAIPSQETDLSNWVSYIYPASYFFLVVIFTYFYTNIVFSAKDISERLQRQGGFIEGVRPGLSTQKYLSGIVNRLNLFGAGILGTIALIPIMAQMFFPGSQILLSGISILIIVAVALETLRQIESQALMVTYEDYDRKFESQ